VGLDHLRFDKTRLGAVVEQLGLRRWTIEDQGIDGYENAAFRFNLYAWKDDL